MGPMVQRRSPVAPSRAGRPARNDGVGERAPAAGAERQRCDGVVRCELRFGLLGTPVLHRPAPGTTGHSVQEVGSPKLRILLAALLLGAGRVVSVGALKDALWGGAPPPSAHPSLHNHVARLRRMLDAPDRLVTGPTGYLLRVGQGELDVHVFDALTDTARAAHTAGDGERVVRACTDALALWRGAPLAGLPPEVGGHALARRLREARLLLLEWRYDAELGFGGDQGRLSDLVPELTALAAEHPLREAYHRQLMLALHRTGRRAEALAVHRDLRARLVEELGIEPGPEVRRAHVEVLQGTDTVRSEAWPGAARVPASPGVGAGAGVALRSRMSSGGGPPPSGPGGGDQPRAGDRARTGSTDGGGRQASAGVVPVRDSRPRSSLAPLIASFLASSPAAVRAPAVPAAAGSTTALAAAVSSASSASTAAEVPASTAAAFSASTAAAFSASTGAAASSFPGASASPPTSADVPASAGLPASAAVPTSAAVPASAGLPTSADLPGDAHPAAAGGGPWSRSAGRGGSVVQSSASTLPAASPAVPCPVASSPAEDTRRCAADSGAAPVTRPAQLPPAPVPFVGRAKVRDEVCRVLASPTRRSGGSVSSNASPVAVISGTAGVGKSALAWWVAQELAKRFSDGQLYIDLHGSTPGVTPLAPAQALTALLRDLGCAPCDIPDQPEAAAALLRSLLAPTRTLLVLDGAAHAAQVRPLLPAGPGCAVIVTSRTPLTALDGAARFPLGPLSDEDSAALLREVSGRDVLDAGHPLVPLTGRLPLALRIVAARLRARRALTPETLADQLAEGASRLPHLEYDDLSVRGSLAVTHDALAASERETDRDAALALRRIGALDLPDYGVPLVARLLGTDDLRAEAALARLVDVALLEETAYGRYVPHDLVRDYARELADEAARRDRERRRADHSDRARDPAHSDPDRAGDQGHGRGHGQDHQNHDRRRDRDPDRGHDQGRGHDQARGHDRDRDHGPDGGRVPGATGERAGGRTRVHPRSPRGRRAPARPLTDRATGGASGAEGGDVDRSRSR
ncbi:hypothetical protein SUDANB70_02760 [Streptomyces sp. enrichment culture]